MIQRTGSGVDLGTQSAKFLYVKQQLFADGSCAAGGNSETFSIACLSALVMFCVGAESRLDYETVAQFAKHAMNAAWIDKRRFSFRKTDIALNRCAVAHQLIGE